MEVSDQIHAPAALPRWKNTRCSLDRRLGGPQSRPERGVEKNSQPLPGLELTIIQPVAQRHTTELSRILSQRLY
jgi:hypothetical protein